MNQITGLLDRGHEVDNYAYGRGDNLMINGDIDVTFQMAEVAVSEKIWAEMLSRIDRLRWMTV